MSPRIPSPDAMDDREPGEVEAIWDGRGEGVLDVDGVDAEVPGASRRDISSFAGIRVQSQPPGW